jgi:hypothetical protein
MLRVRGIKLTGSALFTDQSHQVIEFSDPPMWASDPYFDSVNPSSITVPDGLGGKYFLHATLKWTHAMDEEFSEVESNKGYFYAHFEHKRNGNSETLLDTRHTAAPVAEAALTTKVIVWEGDLDDGDSLELRVFDYVVGVDPEAPYSNMLNVYVCLRRL